MSVLRHPSPLARDTSIDDRRRALLSAALGFARLKPRTRPLALLHRWLDTWAGIGTIAVGMERQGFDLQLTKYDARGWRATFYVTGMEHSPTGAIETAWKPTPWRAVRQAACGALTRLG